MLTSRAMQRHEKVADRAGSLVTERVRALIETAQARADRVQRNAADEAHRLDSQRMQSASRIASQIGELEGTLGRLRQQMQIDHAVEGSYVDEGRLIDAVQEREVDAPAGPTAATATFATVTDAVGEPPIVAETPPQVVESPGEGEDPSAQEVEELAAEVQELADEVKSLKAEVEERTAEAGDLSSALEEASAQSDVAGPAPEEGWMAANDPGPALEEASIKADAGPEAAQPDTAGPDPHPEPAEPAGIQEDSTPHVPDPLPEQATQEAYGCGVCGRGFAGNEDELKSLGWVVSASGDVTCADCHSAGWHRPGS